MDIIGLLYLLVAHYLSGRGCLRLLKVELKQVQAFCLSLIIGVPLISLAPCLLQLLNIPIEVTSVYLAVTVVTAVCSIPLVVNFKMPVFKKIALPELYEWPFLIACGALMCVSIWRCFYFPPYARDMLSGPELLAEFAVREKTMISSVFTVELASTNNYFKSPFITSLQIIYKLMVSPFGDVWLSILFLAFMGWLYIEVRSRIHPLLAGFLVLIFMVMPDMYAYTYIILYDYSNMIYFFCGFCFLLRYVNNDRINDLVCASLLLGLATYIRTETLVFIVMLLPVPAIYLYKKRESVKKAAIRIGIFLGLPFAFYVLCMDVFVRNFVPFSFDTMAQVRPDLGNVGAFFTRLKEMNTGLIFSWYGVQIYGYFIFFFCALLITDTIVYRRFNQEVRILLYGIAVIYFGLAFLGYLIPLVDLMNTTKRGFFKALPLMLLFMANSPTLQRLSASITSWQLTPLNADTAISNKSETKIKQKRK